MNFQDEQKQAEYNAFSAYYSVVAQRPYTAAARSLLNQLRTIAVGQYGNGAFQELLRDNKREASPQPEKEVRVGKPTGDGSSRRNQLPGQPKQPKQGSARAGRLAAREQENKSEKSHVVADSIEQISKRPEKIEAADTGNDLAANALTFSAKDLVEKYGRDLIAAHLAKAGESAESLDQKTDRQLANILKKKVSE